MASPTTSKLLPFELTTVTYTKGNREEKRFISLHQFKKPLHYDTTHASLFVRIVEKAKECLDLVGVFFITFWEILNSNNNQFRIEGNKMIIEGEEKRPLIDCIQDIVGWAIFDEPRIDVIYYTPKPTSN